MVGGYCVPFSQPGRRELEPVFPPAVSSDDHVFCRYALVADRTWFGAGFASALLIGSSGGVEHHVAFDSNLLDQIKLTIEEVYMFFLAFQDV